jgi:hypothetical protein
MPNWSIRLWEQECWIVIAAKVALTDFVVASGFQASAPERNIIALIPSFRFLHFRMVCFSSELLFSEIFVQIRAYLFSPRPVDHSDETVYLIFVCQRNIE